jgi:hypothetical protein
VLAHVALGALLLALASPAPVPKPTPTNPFNLNPIPLPSPSSLPIIGTTRAKPVCSAIRRAVAPAVEAAMKTDHTYGVVRKKIFDYVVKDTDAARDLHLTQMDRDVDVMLKSVNALEDALKSPALDVPGNAKPEDAKTLRDLKKTLSGVLAAQKGELNLLSGFVETERMRRFGKLTENEENMRRAVAPSGNVTPMPMTGFLRESGVMIDPTRRDKSPTGLNDGHMIDRDLGDVAAATSRLEEAATKVIVPAANACK